MPRKRSKQPVDAGRTKLKIDTYSLRIQTVTYKRYYASKNQSQTMEIGDVGLYP